MAYLQEILSNRELALLSWILLLIIVMFFVKAFRVFVVDITKSLGSRTFLKVYGLLGLYLIPIIYFSIYLGVWNLKGFLFWLITVGFVLIFKSINVKESKYFKTIIIDAFALTAFYGFIINLYGFGFWTEFILLPMLVLVIVLYTLFETDNKYFSAKTFFNYVLIIIGFVFIAYSLYNTVIDYKNFFSETTVVKFLFPVLLSISFIPFLYLLALFSSYQIYFNQLRFIADKKKKVKKIKRLVLLRANLNLDKLNRIINNFDKRVFYDDTNFKSYIKEISKKPNDLD